MPWCPICKNEYVEGIKECSDCKVPLVDSLDDLRPPVITGKQEEMERLQAFLEYSKFKGIKINHNEETDEYELFCKDKDEEKIRRASTIFYQQESLRNPKMMKKAEEETPETILGDNPVADLYSGSVADDINALEESASDHYDQDDISTAKEENTASEGNHSLKPYQKKSAKAADFKSSAFTLIPLGILGILALIGIELGFIPIHLVAPGKYLTYGVMGSLFVIFVLVGFASLKSSKKYEQDAKEEDKFINELQQWTSEHIDADAMIQKVLQEEGNIQEELLYFKLSDSIKSFILANYDNLDESFLEEFVEGIYHEQFEDKVKKYAK